MLILVQHRFYTDNEEYRKLVDTAIEVLSNAYQVTGRADYEQDVELKNECLQLKTKLSKIAQMNWWKRIVFIFKGRKHDNCMQ